MKRSEQEVAGSFIWFGFTTLCLILLFNDVIAWQAAIAGAVLALIVALIAIQFD